MEKIRLEINIPMVVELDPEEFYFSLGKNSLSDEEFSRIIAEGIIWAQPFTNFVKETNDNDPSLKIISAG